MLLLGLGVVCWLCGSNPVSKMGNLWTRRWDQSEVETFMMGIMLPVYVCAGQLPGALCAHHLTTSAPAPFASFLPRVPPRPATALS